jgi:hypothetical protein
MALFLSLSSIVLALIMLRYNWKINRNALFLSLLIILIASAQTRHYLMLHSTDPFWLAMLINSPTALWSMTGACLVLLRKKRIDGQDGLPDIGSAAYHPLLV